ncbi:DUF2799 domain-containing protein [Oceanisphaera avium]|uniref:DNA repair protein n=1 Tax=Oceanisphaera avium TaxID=1903694 RepID=A0A1Y0CVQ2_9GAMM|nr:DUF2799 domain-containing protein [Oceanisphaera avium]ART79420.1 hypothetical protein CBP12_04020 [Oceanisphaera avium]
MKQISRTYYLLTADWVKFSYISFIVLLLSSCASMSEEQCLTANWLDQGFRDGRVGQPLARLADHRKACAKVGVTPNEARYFEGRDQGILSYCTPENGLRVGRQGQTYRNACPAHLEQAFLVAFDKGKALYETEQTLEKLQQQRQELERLLIEEEDANTRRYLYQSLRERDWELRRVQEEQRYLERRLRYP